MRWLMGLAAERITALENVARELLQATVPGGMGSVRLPDSDANRDILTKLNCVVLADV